MGKKHRRKRWNVKKTYRFHISFIFYKFFSKRAQPTGGQSLAKDYRSFGVVYMSRQVMEILMAISRFYIQILPFRSRNAIFSLHDSYVNLMVVWNSLIRLCKKLWCLQIKKKTLSVYLNHTKGCNSWVSRKAASILSTNMHKVWQARYQ